MIFYTIRGPASCLEIRDDQLILKSQGPFSVFKKKSSEAVIPLPQIRQFMVSRHLGVMGKIVFSDGEQTYSFTFSSSFKMVQMIEKYMQKRILKNIQASAPVISLQERREHKKEMENKTKIASPSLAA
ncbi:MAG: hypothetical protein ACOVP4_04345 [Bacteriovoracaceae bacterium]